MMSQSENGGSDNTKKAVINWIEEILKRKRWTGTDLARKSELAPSTTLRLMNDPEHKFVPSLKTLQKIAEGSGYAIPTDIVDALGSGIVDQNPFDRAPRSFAKTQAPPPTSEMVKITYISSLPASLQAKDVSERSVPLIPQMRDDKTVIAYISPDNTIDPVVPAGAVLYCTRSRDPKAGDIVVIVKKDGRAIVRILMDINSDGLTVSKTVPMTKEDTIDFDAIETIAAVAAIVR